jgi:DNA polymerase-3 subunit delta
MNCQTFLDAHVKAKPVPMYVVTGDEAFLARQAHAAIRRVVLGPDDDGFGVSIHAGDSATWSAVVNDLQTMPFLAPRRLVVVEGADAFVSRERARLEKFVAEVAGKKDPSGVLVLDVKTWLGTTKLAKATPDAWVISCKAPPTHQLPQWCVSWCVGRTGKQLAAAAAKLLVDLVGSEMGVLDQEMQKLAVYIGAAPKIDVKDVDELVGRSRSESTWQIFDLVSAGKTPEALDFLTRLLDQGEEPIKLLGAFGSQLRRLAQTTRLRAQGVALGEAMSRAGVPNFPQARTGAEALLKHLGRRRLDRVYDWLLELDVGLKGGSHLPDHAQLERFIIRLARPRA